MKQKEGKEVEVDKCESCPMFQMELNDSEYCSQEGHPESRYSTWDQWEKMPEKKPIPDDCPLLQGSIIIKLKDIDSIK